MGKHRYNYLPDLRVAIVDEIRDHEPVSLLQLTEILVGRYKFDVIKREVLRLVSERLVTRKQHANSQPGNPHVYSLWKGGSTNQEIPGPAVRALVLGAIRDLQPVSVTQLVAGLRPVNQRCTYERVRHQVEMLITEGVLTREAHTLNKGVVRGRVFLYSLHDNNL
jgi:predicted transcriptional regulator